MARRDRSSGSSRKPRSAVGSSAKKRRAGGDEERSSRGSRGSRGTKARDSKSVGGTRGAEGRKRAIQEQVNNEQRKKERQKQSSMPFRFRMAPGTTRSFIIVDEEPDFFRFEHNIKHPRTGKWGTVTGCIQDEDNCPICEDGSDAYYAMFLTIIDLTEFQDRNDNTHEFSRKLLVVKPGQQKKFLRRFEKDGTLRGALFEVSRDGDRDAAIGNDIEFLETVPEEELEEDYIREWKNHDGKVVVEDCSEVFDYEELFPPVTADDLMEYATGSSHSPGSTQANREAMKDDDDGDFDDDDDEAPWEEEEEEKPRRSARSKPTRGRSDKKKSPVARRSRR